MDARLRVAGLPPCHLESLPKDRRAGRPALGSSAATGRLVAAEGLTQGNIPEFGDPSLRSG